MNTQTSPTGVVYRVPPDGFLNCAMCNKWKDRNAFPRNPRKKFGRGSYCNACTLFRSRRARGMKIELDTYDTLLRDQVGLCAICGETGYPRGLAVDHDHDTGKVRALLCRGCNQGLGLFRENLSALRGAVAYLEQHCA